MRYELYNTNGLANHSLCTYWEEQRCFCFLNLVLKTQLLLMHGWNWLEFSFHESSLSKSKLFSTHEVEATSHRRQRKIIALFSTLTMHTNLVNAMCLPTLSIFHLFHVLLWTGSNLEGRVSSSYNLVSRVLSFWPWSYSQYYSSLFNMADQMGSDSLLNQAESMWKMLDDMAESDPDAYKKFIDKALKDGATSLKPPEPCFCISTILVSMATSTFTS